MTVAPSARHHAGMIDDHRPATLLQVGDPAPVIVRNGDAVPPVLIVADHAGRAVPRLLDSLGLPERELWRHIAWDVGALDLATGLADQLGAPMLASAYSRLVIDCNRYPADPMSIAPASDGCDVPGNAGIDVIQRERRAQEIFRPYHDAIADTLSGAVARGTTPLLLAIHTMTPRMAGRDRPQHVTVCWTLDDHLPNQAIRALRRQEGLVVGDNDPYAVDLGVDYTVPEHALRRGLPYLMLEVRQDLVATPADAAVWVERLVPVVREVLADPGCMAPRRLWP